VVGCKDRGSTIRWAGSVLLGGLLLLSGCGRGTPAGDEYTLTVRARALLENGHAEAAVRTLRSGDLQSARALFNLGLAQHEQGAHEKAAESWRRALERDPHDVRSNYHLAACELETASHRKPRRATEAVQHAVDLLERARTYDPGNPAILRLLSDALARQERTQLADSLGQEAERLDPDRAGRVPEAFGFGHIVLPDFDRAPSVTRHAPRFHLQELEAQARDLVEVPQAVKRHASGFVLVGTRAWLRNQQTVSPENIHWAAQSILDGAILGGVSAPFDADASADVVLWTRITPRKATAKRSMRTQVWFATWSADSLAVRPLMELPFDILDMLPLDVDADRDIDLVVGASGKPGIRVWRNDGRGAFREDEDASWFADSVPMHDLHAADLNGDHVQDLVSIDLDDGLHLWGGRQHGRFSEVTHQAGLDGLRARTLALADLDADGLDDLLLGDDDALWIHFNRGSLQFERNAAYRDARSEWSGEQERGVPVTSIQVADFDNDGKLDVLTQHFKDPDARRVVARSGQSAQEMLQHPAGGHEDTAPPHRDSLLDVPDTVRLALWRNEGHGILTDVTVQAGLDAQWTQPRPPVVADLDQDGDLDMACVGPDNRVHLLWSRNEGQNRRVVFDWGSVEQAHRAFGARLDAYAGRRVLQTRAAQGVVSLGIGTLEKIDVLRIRWADGGVQNVLDLQDLRLADDESQRLVLQVQP
jgi:hypothetical protein